MARGVGAIIVTGVFMQVPLGDRAAGAAHRARPHRRRAGLVWCAPVCALVVIHAVLAVIVLFKKRIILYSYLATT